MLIGVIKERINNENRVAATPETVGRLIADGIDVYVEKNAGYKAGYNDDAYANNGAIIKNSAAEICHNSNMLFKIWAPQKKEWSWLTHTPIILADFSRCPKRPDMPIRAFDLNKIPRISRAQNMDILSSQDNLAGYKAAIIAVNMINRSVPMMITSAGTLAPLKILIWGLGIAGLQAAATAKRLGAKVFAADIRPESKKQAASVGASFIPSGDIPKQINNFDIIITAAGSYKHSPLLINEHLFSLISSSVPVIDISGNVHRRISAANLLRGYNLPSLLANSSSQLFANNLYNFFRLIYDFQSQNLNLNFNDEIINQTYIGERHNV